MKKTLYIALVLVAALFIALTLSGNGGLGVAYKILAIVVIIFEAAQAIAKAVNLKDRDALFTGSLGLGTLAVSELYTLAYMFVEGETAFDLTISSYGRASAQLFFLAAIMLLLLPPIRWEQLLRTGAGIASAVLTLAVIYALIANNQRLLGLSSMALACLCVFLAGYLFYQSRRVRQLRNAHVYAASVIALSMLYIIGDLFSVTKNSGFGQEILIALCPLVYVWLGDGLLALRQDETEAIR